MRILLNNADLSQIEEGPRPACSGDLAARLSKAIRRTHLYYMRTQHACGYWWFELESNVTITAEYLMLLHFAGMIDTERDKKIAGHLFKHQRPDGTWPIHEGGKGDMSRPSRPMSP